MYIRLNFGRTFYLAKLYFASDNDSFILSAIRTDFSYEQIVNLQNSESETETEIIKPPLRITIDPSRYP